MSTGYDEFRRYPIETLIDGGGDCEDTTILVAALLRGLGEKPVLIFTPGHIALGISGNFSGASVTYNGTEYYYCETTGTGWTVGDLPSSSGTKVTRIIPLTASEIATTPKPNEVVIPTPTPRRPAPDITTPTPQTPQKARQLRLKLILSQIILLTLRLLSSLSSSVSASLRYISYTAPS